MEAINDKNIYEEILKKKKLNYLSLVVFIPNFCCSCYYGRLVSSPITFQGVCLGLRWTMAESVK